MNEFGVAISGYPVGIVPPSYEENKRFEEYLLIKNAIEEKCACSIAKNLLQHLEQAYTTDQDLINVLK